MRKLLSVFLSVVMIFTLVPQSVGFAQTEANTDKVPVTRVVIEGEPYTGSTLTAVATGADGKAATNVQYQWWITSQDTTGGEDSPVTDTHAISNATAKTWKIEDYAGEDDSQIFVKVTGEDGSRAESEKTVVIKPATAQSKMKEDARQIELPATVDSAQTLTLPSAGATNNSAVTWSSDNEQVISNAGVVTLPSVETTVNLTATFNLQGESYQKVFPVVVKAGQTVDPQDTARVEEAAAAMKKSLVYNAVYGTDTTAAGLLKRSLEGKGFNDVDVEFVSTKEEEHQAVKADGNLSYVEFPIGDGENTLYAKSKQSPIKYLLKKGNAQKEVDTKINTYWNTDYLVAQLKAEVIDRLTEEMVKGENTSLNDFTKSVTLPEKLAYKNKPDKKMAHTTITWSVDNNAVGTVDKQQVPGGSWNDNQYVFTPEVDGTPKTAVLKATLKFGFTNYNTNEDEVVKTVKKEFNISVPGEGQPLPQPTEEDIQRVKEVKKKAGDLSLLKASFGVDQNIDDLVKRSLKAKSFEADDVEFKVSRIIDDKNNTKAPAIAEDGNIKYVKKTLDDPDNAIKGVDSNNKTKVLVRVRKGGAVDRYQTTVQSFWDRDFLKAELNKNIFDKATDEMVRGENPALQEMTKEVLLPRYMKYDNSPKEKLYSFLTWTVEPAEVGKVEEYTPPGGTYSDKVYKFTPAKVEEGGSAKQGKLKLKINFRFTNGQVPEEKALIDSMFKDFEITVPAPKAKQQFNLTASGEGLTVNPVAGMVEENTQVVATLTVPEGKKVKSFKVNTIEKKDDLVQAENVYTYTFNITENTDIVSELETVEETPFKFTPETNTITGYKTPDVPVDLVIPEKINGVTVKHIGRDAFKYSTFSSTVIKKPLESLTLPDSIETIGYMAFQGNNLKTVRIPLAMETLGERAFFGNSKLTKVEYPEGTKLQEVGVSAFDQCAMEAFELPATVKRLLDMSFKKNKYKEVRVPEGVQQINTQAFAIANIEKAYFPSSIVSLGLDKKNTLKGDIFFNNTDSTGKHIFTRVYDKSGKATPENTGGIVNPASVKIKYVNEANQQEIQEAKTVVGVSKKTLQKDGRKYLVIDGDNSYLTDYQQPLDAFQASDPANIVQLAGNYFVKGGTYTFAAPAIENYEAVEATVQKQLDADADENEVVIKYRAAQPQQFNLTASGEGLTVNPQAGMIAANTQVVATLTVPEGKKVKSFKVNTVEKKDDLVQAENVYTYTFNITENTDIVSELETVEETPFKFTPETNTITGYKTPDVPVDLVIPEKINGVTVKHIGKDAFKYSTYGQPIIKKPLESLTLPDSIETIGYMAFQGNNLKKVRIPLAMEVLGSRAFFGNSKLTTVEFPEGTKIREIGSDALYNTGLTTIKLPATMRKLADSSLKGNPLTTVELNDGLETIEDQAFSLDSIESIELPASLTTITYKPKKSYGLFFRNSVSPTDKRLRLTKVFDNSGVATALNTRGIVNPATVKFKYVNAENQEEIRPAETAVGVKVKELKKEQVNAYKVVWSLIEGDNSLIKDYITPLQDETKFYTDEALFEGYTTANYFSYGKAYTLKAPKIDGFSAVNATEVKTLVKGTNEVEFRYNKESDVALNVTGEGVVTDPATPTVPKGSTVKIKVLEPANKKLKSLKINNVEKKDELKFNGVAYSHSLQANEDINIVAEYDDVTYQNEFEFELEKNEVDLGDEIKYVLKYRGNEITDASAFEFELPQGAVKLNDETKLKSRKSGDYSITAKLKDKPELTLSKQIKINPVKVTVRLEDDHNTELYPTETVIDKLYVEKGVDYWESIEFNDPVPFLAIAKVVKQTGFANPTDKLDFDCGSKGGWMNIIGKDKFTYGGNNTFMYDVNNVIANKVISDFKIKSGDKIKVYHLEDWGNMGPNAYFEKDEYKIKKGQTAEFKLCNNKLVNMDPVQTVVEPIQGAILEVTEDGGSSSVGTEETDAHGVVTHKFTKTGVFHISAVKSNGSPMSRPYAKVVVEEANKVKVKYQFESKTDGKPIPAEVNAVLPEEGTAEEGNTVKPAELTKKEVEVADGKWKFVDWNQTEVVAGTEDITFVGNWKFEKKPAKPKTWKMGLYVYHAGTKSALRTPKGEDRSKLVWKSNNTKLASVDKRGVVTLKAPGATTIKATYKHKTFVYAVRISPKAVTRVRGTLKRRYVTMQWKPSYGMDGVFVYRAEKKNGKYVFKVWDKIRGSKLTAKKYYVGKGKRYAYMVKAYKLIAGRHYVSKPSRSLYFYGK